MEDSVGWQPQWEETARMRMVPSAHQHVEQGRLLHQHHLMTASWYDQSWRGGRGGGREKERGELLLVVSWNTCSLHIIMV